MTVRLTLKAEPDQRLDLSPLVPHLLAGKSEAEVAALELQTTKEKRTVGDLFSVKLDGDGAALRIEGGSSRFDHVGAGLSSGEILLEGDCGQSAGRAMSGGTLTILGAAGPFAASAMVTVRMSAAAASAP